MKILEYPTYSTIKPPNKEPNATPRGENTVSKTAAPRGKEVKTFEIYPDLEELDKKLPNSPISIRIRIPTNPTKDADKPIAIDDIPNRIPPIKTVLIILEPDNIFIPYQEIGRKRIENKDEYANISACLQPILLRNIKKKD